MRYIDIILVYNITNKMKDRVNIICVRHEDYILFKLRYCSRMFYWYYLSSCSFLCLIAWGIIYFDISTRWARFKVLHLQNMANYEGEMRGHCSGGGRSKQTVTGAVSVHVPASNWCAVAVLWQVGTPMLAMAHPL